MALPHLGTAEAADLERVLDVLIRGFAKATATAGKREGIV
jgi:hypothetical protein